MFRLKKMLFIFILAIFCLALTACADDTDNGIEKESLMFYDFPITVKHHLIFTGAQDSLRAGTYQIPVFSNLNLREENDPITNNIIFFELPYIIEGVGENTDAITIKHQQHPPSIPVYEEGGVLYEEGGMKYYYTVFYVQFGFSNKFREDLWGESAVFTAFKVKARGEIHEVKVDITIDFIKPLREQSKFFYGGGCDVYDNDDYENYGRAQFYTLSQDISELAIERIFIEKEEYSYLIQGISSLEIQDINDGGATLKEYYSLDINDIKHEDELIFAGRDQRIYLRITFNEIEKINYYSESFPIYATIRLMPSDETVTIAIGYLRLESSRRFSRIPYDYHNKIGLYENYAED